MAKPHPASRPPKAPQPSAQPDFYIAAATSLVERRLRTLKHGDTFAVFDDRGDIDGRQSAEGLFHNDTRHVSQSTLLINGQNPHVLSSVIQDDNGLLSVDLTNGDIFRNGRVALKRESIHIGRRKFLWNAACYERLAIRNFGLEPCAIEISFLFDGDFRDLFEVRGQARSDRGQVVSEAGGPFAARLRYSGLDSIERYTEFRFSPTPTRLDEASATYVIELIPGQRATLFAATHCFSPSTTDAARSFFVCFRQARRALQGAVSKIATVESSNEILNEVFSRSTSDVSMLVTDTSFGPYPYAGIPWYSAPFGRDGVITALQMLWANPELAKGVLSFLAGYQTRREEKTADATPGKILHEARKGEMANLLEVPFGRYYGSVDATPLFVVLAGMYYERTGDLATIVALWPNIQAALRWIREYGDGDGDGFVEYFRQTNAGLSNQGWKDSHDAIFHANGELAQGPIALAEVQGYVYAAKRHAGALARALDLPVMAAELEKEATDLQTQFEATFWCEELGTYALALDGDKRPCRVAASNAGHLLFSGIANPERAAQVAQRLLDHSSFSGWGIRTVAGGQARYNPMSYHNGSIWPHDNAIIALGLARYGLKQAAGAVFEGIFEAASHMELRRLPELFCGFSRRRHSSPTPYPVACSPQAWAAASPFAFIAACLGLECDGGRNELRLNRPVLPSFVDHLTIRNLRIGSSRLSLTCRRYTTDVAVNLLERTGDARVIVLS